MKKAAPHASSSNTKGQSIEEDALWELETASHMDAISAHDGSLTPIESAILSMDADLQAGMRLIREIKNQTTMLETAFKLMSYEMTVLVKHLRKK